MGGEPTGWSSARRSITCCSDSSSCECGNVADGQVQVGRELLSAMASGSVHLACSSWFGLSPRQAAQVWVAQGRGGRDLTGVGALGRQRDARSTQVVTTWTSGEGVAVLHASVVPGFTDTLTSPTRVKAAVLWQSAANM